MQRQLRSIQASSILFGLILCLSLALVVWWTIFQVTASHELEAAGARLANGDAEGAARALGAAGSTQLAELARARFLMFASEGAVFAGVLLGGLYLGEVALWLRALGMIHAVPLLFVAVVLTLAGGGAAGGGRVGRWAARVASA